MNCNLWYLVVGRHKQDVCIRLAQHQARLRNACNYLWYVSCIVEGTSACIQEVQPPSQITRPTSHRRGTCETTVSTRKKKKKPRDAMLSPIKVNNLLANDSLASASFIHTRTLADQDEEDEDTPLDFIIHRMGNLNDASPLRASLRPSMSTTKKVKNSSLALALLQHQRKISALSISPLPVCATGKYASVSTAIASSDSTSSEENIVLDDSDGGSNWETLDDHLCKDSTKSDMARNCYCSVFGGIAREGANVPSHNMEVEPASLQKNLVAELNKSNCSPYKMITHNHKTTRIALRKKRMIHQFTSRCRPVVNLIFNSTKKSKKDPSRTTLFRDCASITKYLAGLTRGDATRAGAALVHVAIVWLLI
jgi:hypothetical protein